MAVLLYDDWTDNLSGCISYLAVYVSAPVVMIRVQACLDYLLAGYDYGIEVCLAVLVMDSVVSQREYHMYDI